MCRSQNSLDYGHPGTASGTGITGLGDAPSLTQAGGLRLLLGAGGRCDIAVSNRTSSPLLGAGQPTEDWQSVASGRGPCSKMLSHSREVALEEDVSDWHHIVQTDQLEALSVVPYVRRPPAVLPRDAGRDLPLAVQVLSARLELEELGLQLARLVE